MLTASISALLLFSPTQGFARQASSFEQLKLRVHKGDQVTVTTGDGKVTKGRLEEISGSTLRLVRNAMPVELPEANVLEIKKKDPIGNGALMGAGVGAGLGVLLSSGSCRSSGGLGRCAGPEGVAGVALAIGVGAGLGAGIGVLADAVIKRNPVVYRGQPRTRTSRISFGPLLSAQRRGVGLSFSF